MATIATSVVTTTTIHRAITAATYKGLLRAAAKLDARPAVINPSTELAALVAGLPALALLPNVTGAATCTAAVRAAFRAPDSAPTPTAVDTRLNLAVKALAAANKRATALAVTDAAVSGEGAGGAVARHAVGTVIQHRVHGYRGVIVGWDASCRASDKWVAATGAARLPHGVAQPFYHVLVDVRDRPTAQITYVAQDSIDCLSGKAGVSASDLVVVHPLVPRYFDSLRLDQGTYVPSTTAISVAAATRAIRQPTSRTLREGVAAGAGGGGDAASSSASSSDDEDDAGVTPVAARLV